MASDIDDYNQAQSAEYEPICTRLAELIGQGLKGGEGKVWHGGPVWFLEGNPIVGYWVRKKGVGLLFWSGQSFDEPELEKEGKFKAAQKVYESPDDIDEKALKRWLKKGKTIQWDYQNIVKRKGVLEKLGDW